MADELRQLKEAYASPGASSKIAPSPSSGQSYSDQQIPIQSPSDILLTLPSNGPFELGLQSFEEAEINQRFAMFVEHFHPRLPLLDLETSKAYLYGHCPFLFWAIITVTCRYDPLQNHDQALFYDGFQSLLRTVALSAPLSLQSVQALLLVCTWPPPTRNHLYDSGWLYYSLALGGATYLKLDHAHRNEDYGFRLQHSDISNMSRTWLAVFSVSQSFSTWTGVDLTLKQPSDLAMIDAHVDRLLISELSARAAISRISAKHTSQITETLSIVTHEALIELSSADLDSVTTRFFEIWSPQLAIVAQATRLSLIASLLVACGKLRTKGEPYELTSNTIDVKLSRHILLGSHLAFQIISQFDLLIGHPTDDDPNAPSHNFYALPKMYFAIIMFTAFFLLRFCNTNRFCREEDRMAAHHAVETVKAALLRASRDSTSPDGGDEPARSTRTLDLLLRFEEDAGESDRYIEDRGSGSLLWDTIRRIKILRGQGSNHATLLHLINPSIPTDIKPAVNEFSGDDSILEQFDSEFMQQFLDVGQFEAFAGDDFLSGS